MLDLGVYPVSFAHYFLGAPATIEVVGSQAPTGVDYEAGVLLGYPDGRSASILISLRHSLPGAARIFGTEGWIELPPRFHHPKRLVLHRTGRDPETIEQPPLGTGYAHEMIEVNQGVQAGRTESTVMPLDDTRRLQRTLKRGLRGDAGRLPRRGRRRPLTGPSRLVEGWSRRLYREP